MFFLYWYCFGGGVCVCEYIVLENLLVNIGFGVWVKCGGYEYDCWFFVYCCVGGYDLWVYLFLLELEVYFVGDWVVVLGVGWILIGRFEKLGEFIFFF